MTCRRRVCLRGHAIRRFAAAPVVVPMGARPEMANAAVRLLVTQAMPVCLGLVFAIVASQIINRFGVWLDDRIGAEVAAD